MSYVSNLQNDDIIRRDRAEFAAALRGAAASPALAVVRVTPYITRAGTCFYVAEGWTYNFVGLALDVVEQLALVSLLRTRRADIAWAAAAHEYRLDEAMLRRAPAPGQLGHRPPVHRVFGGKDPVFLPRTIPSQRTRSEATA